MLASVLVARLQELIAKSGDRDVVCRVWSADDSSDSGMYERRSIGEVNLETPYPPSESVRIEIGLG